MPKSTMLDPCLLVVLWFCPSTLLPSTPPITGPVGTYIKGQERVWFNMIRHQAIIVISSVCANACAHSISTLLDQGAQKLIMRRFPGLLKAVLLSQTHTSPTA